MAKFLSVWDPVANWPENDRVSASQAAQALSTPECRYAFAEWRKRHDESAGTRGETVPRKYVIEKWTAKLSIARLVYLLYRLQTRHPAPAGLFGGVHDVEKALDALLDLVFEVRDQHCPSKRFRSALVALIFPDVRVTEKQRFGWPKVDWCAREGAPNASGDAHRDEFDTKTSTDNSDASSIASRAGASHDALTNAFTGFRDASSNAPRVGTFSDTPTNVSNMEAFVHVSSRSHNASWKTPSAGATIEASTSASTLKAFSNASVDLFPNLHDTIVLQDSALDMPSVWPSGPSLQDACNILHIHNKTPFHITGTPAQRFWWYQVKGIAHIKVCLLEYGKAALLDFMGLGKTRQSLVGLEMALLSSKINTSQKPSLIIVPSGQIGEHWISEGLLASNRFSFVAVGDGFSQEHQDSRNGFHAIVVDEAQQMRKWKGSATFLSIDKLKPTSRLGLTATPRLNGTRDMKGFLTFFRDRHIDVEKTGLEVARHGISPYEKGVLAKYQAMPEMWEQCVDNGDLQMEETTLRKLPKAMPFVISRNSNMPNDDKSTTIGAGIPALYVSRQTITFGSQDSEDAFTNAFNQVLGELWREVKGCKFINLPTLTNLATMTLSKFAARIPADHRFVHQLHAEDADLPAVCQAVLKRNVSEDEASYLVRSPKLDWLAAFLGRAVVDRREKVLIFVLNNREQLLERAFLKTLGLGPLATFHSGLGPKHRRDLIDSFNGSGGPSIFITTWEMGSVGFNLQKNCRIVVALSLYYNRNAEMQGRARVHQPGQTRPVVYIQCRQSPSLDTVFMLKHSDRKRSAEFYARLQLAKEDKEKVDKVLEAVSSAMAGIEEGAEAEAALELDLQEVGMSSRLIEVLQTVLAGDTLSYCKNLKEL
ncbi:P-loop containing nucleoside triphosphate hydrolase protein [Phyllosticta citriasiana]|uniref:P-loop containing nucleoside triphosphate hydrolase protein n=1 Tax=Phyllosticta citriasiana TaxID=595635 RepID=UPI0030FDBF31